MAALPLPLTYTPRPRFRLPRPRWDRIGALTFCAAAWGAVFHHFIGSL